MSVTTRGVVRAVNLSTGTGHLLFNRPKGRSVHHSLSLNARYAAIGFIDGSVEIVNARSGETVISLSGRGSAVEAPAALTSADRAVIGWTDGTIGAVLVQSPPELPRSTTSR